MAFTAPGSRLRSLTKLAASQGGYFTAQQARRFGYGAPHLSYHASVGNFERAGHGIYRVTMLPVADHDDLVRLRLWSRGRDDRPVAMCSHQTALDLHGLSEAIPDVIHLSVPRGFRKAAPLGCVLHIATVGRTEMHHIGAVLVTTPQRTLADLARDASFPHEQFVRAARRAHANGMIDSVTRNDLLALRRSVVRAATSTHRTSSERSRPVRRKARP